MENNDMDVEKAIKILLKSCEDSRESRGIFFEKWKESVKLAGLEYFGDGTKEGFEKSRVIDDLRPNKTDVMEALGYLSPGQAAFLASLYSFYNSYTAVEFCKTLNLNSVGDLSILDTKRRKLIAELLIHYGGW